MSDGSKHVRVSTFGDVHQAIHAKDAMPLELARRTNHFAERKCGNYPFGIASIFKDPMRFRKRGAFDTVCDISIEAGFACVITG
jgi:hypothetical protein